VGSNRLGSGTIDHYQLVAAGRLAAPRWGQRGWAKRPAV